MNELALVTVNFSQRSCAELLLKSYVFHHYTGEPLQLIFVDNASTDDSREWLAENEIPFIQMQNNVGHENALNSVYKKYKIKYWLLNDTDVEYLDNVYDYINVMDDVCISVGELINKDYINDIKIKDRISPWFWLFNIEKIINSGVEYFRDPSCENWTYDVASWQTERMFSFGFAHHNLVRHNWNQDNDIVSMRYDKIHHIGKVSWDLEKHPDRYSEVMRRRYYIKDRLKEYEHVTLKGKFVCPPLVQ